MAWYKTASLSPLELLAVDRPILDRPDYVAKAYREIAHWERARRGAIGKLTDLVLAPTGVFTDRMVPPWLRTFAALVIEKALRLAAYASALSVDEETLVRERKRLIGRKKPLQNRSAFVMT